MSHFQAEVGQTYYYDIGVSNTPANLSLCHTTQWGQIQKPSPAGDGFLGS